MDSPLTGGVCPDFSDGADRLLRAGLNPQAPRVKIFVDRYTVVSLKVLGKGRFSQGPKIIFSGTLRPLTQVKH